MAYFGNLIRRGPEPHTRQSAVPIRTRTIRDGVPDTVSPLSFHQQLAFADLAPDQMALTVVARPTNEIIAELATAWELHPLLVEDLLHAGQRPKIERYGSVLFLVVRAARYLDEQEEVEFSEFHVLIRPGAVIIIGQDLTDADLRDGLLEDVERRLLANPDLLKMGPEALAYRFLDEVVDGYLPVLAGLDTDKEQIEREVFTGKSSVAERIYRLSQEVIDLQHATTALNKVLQGLRRGADKYRISEDLQAYLQDVTDHLTRVVTETTELRDSLSQILNVNATLVAQRQSEDMKKISAWAAIIFAPSLIGSIYGMNFEVMPELEWAAGYPLAIVAMLVFAVILYVVFKRRNWL